MVVVDAKFPAHWPNLLPPTISATLRIVMMTMDCPAASIGSLAPNHAFKGLRLVGRP